MKVYLQELQHSVPVQQMHCLCVFVPTDAASSAEHPLQKLWGKITGGRGVGGLEGVKEQSLKRKRRRREVVRNFLFFTMQRSGEKRGLVMPVRQTRNVGL